MLQREQQVVPSTRERHQRSRSTHPTRPDRQTGRKLGRAKRCRDKPSRADFSSSLLFQGPLSRAHARKRRTTPAPRRSPTHSRPRGATATGFLRKPWLSLADVDPDGQPQRTCKGTLRRKRSSPLHDRSCVDLAPGVPNPHALLALHPGALSPGHPPRGEIPGPLAWNLCTTTGESHRRRPGGPTRARNSLGDSGTPWESNPRYVIRWENQAPLRQKDPSSTRCAPSAP